YWKDQHLRWTPAEHEGIQQVHLDPSDLWMPDLALYNRVGGDVAPTWGAAPLLVKSDGTVMWFPPSYFKVPCALDLALWPRDTHNCTVSLGSWAHYGAQLDLVLMGNNSGVVMGELHQGPQWEVVGVVGARNTHIDLTIVFTVTRRASQHAAYINTSMMGV
ncbi:neuronal acetylcholine receptor subunit alpha-6, partial [Hyalella azteca]|uniref:Neuronal acetylcholine receptor subunit alpha-6 n=1 Tax=Hyalella azteca TaxID=294128 RepID=A0A8B7P3U7_HYAAZ